MASPTRGGSRRPIRSSTISPASPRRPLPIRRFPTRAPIPTSVPDRATAEKRCREMGITDRRLLDNCIVDIAMTSDFLFASSYSHAQQVLAARAATTPAPSHGVLRTVVDGRRRDGSGTAARQDSSRGQAGDVVWIGAPDCEDHYLGAAFDGPGGKSLPGAWPCAIGRAVLPHDGHLQDADYRTDLPTPTGTYYVPIRFVRPDRVKPIAYGDVVFGNIETRGAHDVYTFTANAGDLLRIAGPGCDISNTHRRRGLVEGERDAWTVVPARHGLQGARIRERTSWSSTAATAERAPITSSSWAPRRSEPTGRSRSRQAAASPARSSRCGLRSLKRCRSARRRWSRRRSAGH